MTGTEGTATYVIIESEMPSDSSKAIKVLVHWDAPYKGENSYSSSIHGEGSSNYSIISPDDSTQKGDNVIMEWTLVAKG